MCTVEIEEIIKNFFKNYLLIETKIIHFCRNFVIDTMIKCKLSQGSRRRSYFLSIHVEESVLFSVTNRFTDILIRNILTSRNLNRILVTSSIGNSLA